MKATSRTTNTEQQEKQIEFPILMKDQHTSAVVLFTGNTTGVCIFSTKQSDIGYWGSDWLHVNNCTWTPFTGEIILKNE